MKFQEIAHLYIGCRLMFEKSGKIITFTAFTFDADNIMRVYGERAEGSFPLSVYNFKPILRKISDMTDIERKDIYTMIFKKNFPSYGTISYMPNKSLSSDMRWILESGIDRLGIEKNGTIWARSNLLNVNYNQHAITKYLLSKGFDLFGLIPLGTAIDAKTINI